MNIYLFPPVVEVYFFLILVICLQHLLKVASAIYLDKSSTNFPTENIVKLFHFFLSYPAVLSLAP